MKKTEHQPNFLEMVPIRNIQEFSEEGEKITLLVPKFKSAWMRKWLIPPGKSKHVKVKLDVMGSKVWRLIDGSNDINTICSHLMQKNINDPEFEKKVVQFISNLAQNKLIYF